MEWKLAVENIAGIRKGSAEIHPGRNVVQGANWKGKSSFLQAIETVMGTRTPLTEGATSGRVELETPGNRQTVELERRNGTVIRNGTPFLDEEYDRICADLYAFLDERNTVREAVRRGKNLEDHLTKPLDFENIEEEIADRKAERSQVEAELEQARDAARRLPDLQERVTQLEDELSDLETERAEFDGSTDDEEDDDRRELSDLRAEQSQTEQRIERLTDAVTRIEDKLAEVRTEYESLTIPEKDIETELAEVRERHTSIQTDIDLLQSVYSANKRVLDEGRVDLLTDVERTLLADELNCWLCGRKTTEEEFREHLTDLSDKISALESEALEHKERAEELESQRREVQEAQRKHDDLERRIDDLEAKLSDRRESLASAEERKIELDQRISELDNVLEDQRNELADIKSEIKQTETELEAKREELERIDRQADQQSQLETEYERLSDEIEDLRNRKTEIKQRTRKAFDNAISDLLERFDTSFETARLTSDFDLVVARNGRKANLDALSEGELELLGIVAALAGHDAFEVADRVPILLLDQLGSLSEQNLSTLIEYLDDRAEFLVFTAYPEHDSFDDTVIDPTDWDIVSENTRATAAS